MASPQNDPSIIEVITTMVREGESEAKILESLRQLGVDPQKAQRLLLLAQADTFSLLRSEISKIVKQDLQAQQGEVNSAIQKQAQVAVERAKKSLEDDLKKEMTQYETQDSLVRKTHDDQLDDKVKKYSDLADVIRVRVNALSHDVEQVKIDQDSMKLRGVGNQNRIVSLVLLAFGVLFVFADLVLFVTNFGLALTIDSILIFIVIALIGVTMMFVAALV